MAFHFIACILKSLVEMIRIRRGVVISHYKCNVWSIHVCAGCSQECMQSPLYEHMHIHMCLYVCVGVDMCACPYIHINTQIYVYI